MEIGGRFAFTGKPVLSFGMLVTLVFDICESVLYFIALEDALFIWLQSLGPYRHNPPSSMILSNFISKLKGHANLSVLCLTQRKRIGLWFRHIQDLPQTCKLFFFLRSTLPGFHPRHKFCVNFLLCFAQELFCVWGGSDSVKLHPREAAVRSLYIFDILL